MDLSGRQPLNLGQEKEVGADDYMAKPTYGESFSASVKLAYEEGPVMSWARQNAVENLEKLGQEKVSPDKLNELYPGMEVAFDKPTSRTVADYLWTRQQERNLLRERASGNNSVSNFAASIVGSLADPVNFAVNYGVGLAFRGVQALSKGAKSLSDVKKISQAAQASETTLGAVAREAGEGLVGSVVTEPLSYMAAQKEQQDYTITDALTNVAVGSLAFPVGMGAVKGLAKGAKKLMAINPDADRTLKMYAKTQLENDKVVNVDPAIDEQLNMKRAQDATASNLDYSQPQTGEFYGYSIKGGQDITSLTSFGEDLGDAIQLTTKKDTANNFAINDFSDADGVVHSVNLDNARILDLDKPVDGSNITKESFLDLPEAKKKEFIDKIKSEGYDGVAYRQEDGSDVLAVFNKEKVQSKNIEYPDRAKRVVPDQSNFIKTETENMTSQKGDFDYDINIDQKVKDLDAVKVDQTDDMLVLKQENDLIDEQIREELAQNKSAEIKDPELEAISERIKEHRAKDLMNEKITKAAIVCVDGD